MAQSKYQSVDVSAVTSYPTLPQVDLSSLFEPTGYLFTLVQTGGTDAVVFISFNGTSDDLVLRAGGVVAKARETRSKKVWVRKSAGAGTVTVDVEAGNSV
jgi:hypothetical protein